MMKLHIYFDSGLLLGAGWPAVSGGLEALFTHASALKIALFLPEPVEVELEHKWVRTLETNRSRLEDCAKEFNRQIARVGKSELALTTPNVEDVLAKYKMTVDALKKKWQLQPVPFTSRPVTDFFRMAARKQLPFEEKDKGFRDTVILFSVIDHLQKTPEVTGWLGSSDGVFKRTDIKEFIKVAGTQLLVYDKVNDLLDAVRGIVADVVKFVWQADEKKALAALRAELPRIQEFVSTNLQVSELDIQPAYGLLTRLERVEVLDITKVRTPLPTKLRSDAPVPILAEIALKLHIIVRMLPVPSPRLLKVGEMSSLNLLSTAEDLPAGYIATEETIERDAEIEATASVSGDVYTNVQLRAVRLRREPSVSSTGYSSLTDILRGSSHGG